MTIRPEHAAIHAALRPAPGPHILTGPIFVRGAEPGDALQVRIVEIGLADDWAFNWIKSGKGALPDEFPDDRLVHLGVDRERGIVRTPWGHEIPARPSLGDGNCARAERGADHVGDSRRFRRQYRQPGAEARRLAFPAGRASKARSSRSATATPRRATARFA